MAFFYQFVIYLLLIAGPLMAQGVPGYQILSSPGETTPLNFCRRIPLESPFEILFQQHFNDVTPPLLPQNWQEINFLPGKGPGWKTAGTFFPTTHHLARFSSSGSPANTLLTSEALQLSEHLNTHIIVQFDYSCMLKDPSANFMMGLITELNNQKKFYCLRSLKKGELLNDGKSHTIIFSLEPQQYTGQWFMPTIKLGFWIKSAQQKGLNAVTVDNVALLGFKEDFLHQSASKPNSMKSIVHSEQHRLNITPASPSEVSSSYQRLPSPEALLDIPPGKNFLKTDFSETDFSETDFSTNPFFEILTQENFDEMTALGLPEDWHSSHCSESAARGSHWRTFNSLLPTFGNMAWIGSPETNTLLTSQPIAISRYIRSPLLIEFDYTCTLQDPSADFMAGIVIEHQNQKRFYCLRSVQNGNLITDGGLHKERFMLQPGRNTDMRRTPTIKMGFWLRTARDENLGIAMIDNVTLMGINEDMLNPGKPATPFNPADLFETDPSESFQLVKNYPNPFNPTTTITYTLPIASNIKIKIYNSMGQMVDVLSNQSQSAGQHQQHWNASPFPSGIYFYQLIASNQQGKQLFSKTHKMTLIK